MQKDREHKTKDKTNIEQQHLKRPKDEDIDVRSKLFSAKSDIEGQDGGMVTALLINGFKEGIFDAAIVVRRTDGYSAQATVAENISDVLAAKGTRYLRVNVTSKLRQLISQGRKRIVVVCTPCEAKVSRRIQQRLKSKSCEVTIIGLFCYEAFNREKLKEEAKARLGIDIDKVEKTQVRQGKFTVQINGKEYSCRLRDLETAREKACNYCDDFTSRLADISVGSIGSKKGYSTVIVRSQAGEKLLKNLKVTKEVVNREEVARLFRLKSARAKKSLSLLKNRK